MAAGAVEVVLGPDPAAFEQLIQHTMSASNDERGHAEAIFNECKHQPDRLIGKLITTMRGSQKQEVRAMCAILLRKVITKDEVSLWPQLSAHVQQGVKEQLLQCVQGEEEKSIMKKLCDTISELAAGIFEEGLWPELLPFLFQCVQAGVDRLRLASLLIFAELVQYVGGALQPYTSTLHQLFKECLAPHSSSDVRIAALRATSNFIQTLDQGNRDKFQDLLPFMMQTLNEALAKDDEEAAQEALEHLIEIAGNEPRFLRKQLVEVVQAMLQIAEAEALDEGVRHLAVEFIVTLAEAREKAPGMMKKLPQFIGRLFAILMGFLLDIEDDARWHTADSEEDEYGDTSNYDVGIECLDRLAMALGGSTVLPVASQLVPPFLQDQDWKKRHAALITLAQIAEGCSKLMVKNLPSVVTMMLSAFNDPHPRVRWAAINAVGQLCTDLGPHLQNEHHTTIMPALMHAMDDYSNPRVQAHASAAVLNFTEECSTDIISPYLDNLIAKLLVLLQQGKRMVQEGALTALASVADCSQGAFEKYYDAVIPFLKTILVNANDKSNRMLRAKSMECISLVGMAVGKDKFRADAKQVMDVLMKLQSADMEDDDPTISYMLQAWARLCKCLGQEFLPYMSVVMPPLLRSAQLKPDVTITDADDDEGPDEDDESIETIQFGDKRIGIRTSVLEEKATACNMLCCYADELKEGFYPFIEQVAPILVPLLKFYFHEEVRKAAVQAIPELLRSAKLAVEKGQAPGKDMAYVKQLSDYLITPLIEAMQKEPETEILAAMLESCNDCIQLAEQMLEMSQVQAMVTQFKAIVEASAARRAERSERRKAEDFDEEELEILEQENEQEEEVFDQVADCLGSLMKVFKAQFIPFLDFIVPFLAPMLDPRHQAQERRVAICIFDDIAEHTDGAGAKYFDLFVPALLAGCVDPEPDIRQASAYGVGICAQHFGARFQPVCSEALARLSQAVGVPDARSPENEMATENAVAALAKLSEFQSESIDVTQVVPLWLSFLPLTGDEVEARVVHELLVRMIERSDPAVLGANNENLPKIVGIFAGALSGKDLVTEEVRASMKSIIQHLQRTLPPDALAATWAALQPHQQLVLQSLLAGPS